MTIHHSGGLEMQGKTGNLGEKSGRGERLAMAPAGDRYTGFSIHTEAIYRLGLELRELIQQPLSPAMHGNGSRDSLFSGTEDFTRLKVISIMPVPF
jgi:hypothetical protein